MNEEHGRKDLEGASEGELKAELEKREEAKWEKRGDDFGKKCDAAFAKLPRPLNSLFDALCLSVIIAFAAWIFTKFGWTGSMPSWGTFGIIFAAIFVLSLIYRYAIKSKCGCCCK